KIKTLKTTQPLFASLHASFPNRRGVEELRILQIRKITSIPWTKKFASCHHSQRGAEKPAAPPGQEQWFLESTCCI
ncbi:MAG: hypothetical protein L6Q55_08655, partial [Azonexus sp.]